MARRASPRTFSRRIGASAPSAWTSPQPRVRSCCAQLATDSDVFVENFKVGALAQYGLDYPRLKALNPRLVYCSITGFGQDGPYASRPGYDFMIQGMSGLMSVTGEPGGQSAQGGRRPRRPDHGHVCQQRNPCRADVSRTLGRGAAYRYRAAGFHGRGAREPGAQLSGERAQPRRASAMPIPISFPMQHSLPATA